MKKILLLLISLMMLVGLSACAVDAKKALEDAYKKSQEASSMHLNVEFVMATEIEGFSLEIPMNMDFKIANGEKSEDTVVNGEISISLLGQKEEMQLQVQDGYLYIIEDGNFIDDVTEIEKTDTSKSLNIMDYVSNVSAKKEGGETIINCKFDFAKVYEEFKDNIPEFDFAELFDIEDVFEDFNDNEVVITIGSDGYFKNLHFETAVEIEDVEVSYTFDFKADGYNNTEVKKFSQVELESMMEIDPSFTFGSNLSEDMACFIEEDDFYQVIAPYFNENHELEVILVYTEIEDATIDTLEMEEGELTDYLYEAMKAQFDQVYGEDGYMYLDVGIENGVIMIYYELPLSEFDFSKDTTPAQVGEYFSIDGYECY